MTQAEESFIATIAPGAQSSMQQTGVPASVTIAQAILETGWGAHMPHGSFNYFGIKAVPGQPSVSAMTTEYVNGEVVHVPAAFASYASPAQGLAAHARLLAGNRRYAPAMAVRADAIAFARSLQDCGYSTNRPPLAKSPPYYADQLVAIMTEFDLQQFDKE